MYLSSDSFYRGDYITCSLKAASVLVMCMNRKNIGSFGPIKNNNEYVAERITAARKPTRDLDKFLIDAKKEQLNIINLKLYSSLISTKHFKKLPLTSISKEFWSWSITLRTPGLYLKACTLRKTW